MPAHSSADTGCTVPAMVTRSASGSVARDRDEVITGYPGGHREALVADHFSCGGDVTIDVEGRGSCSGRSAAPSVDRACSLPMVEALRGDTMIENPTGRRSLLSE